MIAEQLPDGHHWLRVVDASSDDPLDDTFAESMGGRWNPPSSWRTLYLNEDIVTARLNVQLFAARWPYEPEDLVPASGPRLAAARLPRSQTVADAHTPGGLAGADLPATYPLDDHGNLVAHEQCREVGWKAKQHGLQGVRCRAAQSPHGEGRELAWFPATTRSRATVISLTTFENWYWT